MHERGSASRRHGEWSLQSDASSLLDWQTLALLKIQNVKSLPEVLTIEQVHQIIDGCRTQRMAVFFWKQPPPPTGREDEVVAGGRQTRLGLRLEEALNLHIGHIESKRMMVHVHRGKGAKDRYIPLPESTFKVT